MKQQIDSLKHAEVKNKCVVTTGILVVEGYGNLNIEKVI